MVKTSKTYVGVIESKETSPSHWPRWCRLSAFPLKGTQFCLAFIIGLDRAMYYTIVLYRFAKWTAP